MLRRNSSNAKLREDLYTPSAYVRVIQVKEQRLRCARIDYSSGIRLSKADVTTGKEKKMIKVIGAAHYSCADAIRRLHTLYYYYSGSSAYARAVKI